MFFTESRKPELTIKLVANGKELDLDSLSGGERQRLRVCTAIGIADLIKSRCGVLWNLLLLDEPCASVSLVGTEKLLDLLANLGESLIVMLAEHRVLEISKQFCCQAVQKKQG